MEHQLNCYDPGRPTHFAQLPDCNHLRNQLQRRKGSGPESEAWTAHGFEWKAELVWKPECFPATLPVRKRTHSRMLPLDRCCSSGRRAIDDLRAAIAQVRLLCVQGYPHQRAVLDAVPGQILQHPEPCEL